MRATDLDQALVYFNAQERLTGDTLNYWFIERDRSPRQGLRKFLIVKENLRQKILFIGHRGSGKSTELNKLTQELQDHFLTVGFDVLEMTGRSNLEYEDLMLTLITRVTRECVVRALVDRPLLEPIREKWQQFQNWWVRVVAGIDMRTPPAEQSFAAKLNFQIAEIEAGIRQSADTREAIKQQVSNRMPELIDYLNWVIEQAEEADGRHMLIVVEGLDKINLEAATRIFRDNVSPLLDPKASIIYTCPSALLYSPDLGQIRLPFSNTFVLPNIAPHLEGGKADRKGQETLRQLILNRLDERLIEPKALSRVVVASGGVPTSLVTLMQNAALYATGNTITLADVTEAITLLRELMAPSLTEQDWQVLEQRHIDMRLTSDATNQNLLYQGR